MRPHQYIGFLGCLADFGDTGEETTDLPYGWPHDILTFIQSWVTKTTLLGDGLLAFSMTEYEQIKHQLPLLEPVDKGPPSPFYLPGPIGYHDREVEKARQAEKDVAEVGRTMAL